MSRPLTAEEVRRLKEKGVFDVGTSYLTLGLVKPRKHKYWDGYVPRSERAGGDQGDD